MRFIQVIVLLALLGDQVFAQGETALVFTDVTESAGVGLSGVLTESLAWGDYDNDGDQDLYLTNDGANRLFRNDGNDRFTDVTDMAGVGNSRWGVGAAFGDLDNDGDLDLYVVNFQAGSDVLYRNDGPVGPGGVYVFTDVTDTAGTLIGGSSRGMALLDYDRDGLLDIYVNAIGPDILYHNLGGLGFTNVAPELGVDANGQGVGVVPTDVDRNGWIDIYNGNRSGFLSNLYLNNGGQFTDIAPQAGIDGAGLGMGVLAFDYDNDLDMDFYWTTWPGDGTPVPNKLYRNLGNLSFQDVGLATGTDDPNGWGISCNAGDIDNDRRQDFFVTNGFSDTTSPNVLFHNKAGDTFEDITSVLGGGAFDGRGVAFADYDNDGDLDICVTGGAAALTRLWRNDTQNGNHFLSLTLVSRQGNRNGIGARIEVTADGLSTVQEVSGGAGRGSFNSLPVEFGLGSSCKVERLEIFWPNGAHSVFDNLPADRFLTVTGPDGDTPAGYMTTAVVNRGACTACGPALSVVPWVVDNDQWTSKVAIFNNGAAATDVCLEAVTRDGRVREGIVTVAANGVTAIESGTFFPGLTGYSLVISSEITALHTSFLTFNKASASGHSPSQTTAPVLAGLTSGLLFGYVPGEENAAIVLVVPQTGEQETRVTLELLGKEGPALATTEVVLTGNRPHAALIRDLFPEVNQPPDASVKARAQNGARLAGTTFVFNSFREPSMAAAFSID